MAQGKPGRTGRDGGAQDASRRAAVRAVRLCTVGAILVALSACGPQVRKHGYVPSQADLAEISVGLDTRETVADAVGTPSSAGVLNESGYYYVEQQIRIRGVRPPRVLEREVVAISFDDAGIVQDIERFGLQDGNVIALSRRVTDSNVQGIGFLRQLGSNLGRLVDNTPPDF